MHLFQRSRRAKVIAFGSILVCAAAASTLPAADAPAPTTRRAVNNAPPASIVEALKGNDKDAINQALDQIRDAAGKRGRGFAGPEALQVLLDFKRFDDANQMALDVLITHAFDSAYVAGYQKVRVTALMRSGKKEEALAAAKGYYNVVALDHTQDAVNLLADCLATARPKEPGIGKRFINQQIAWATVDPTAAVSPADPATTATASDLGPPVLATIKIDSKPFDDTIDLLFSNKINDILTKGNLLLLADRCSEAQDCFEAGLNHAKGKQSAWLIERIASSIRAQKGCVAPANAYIQSVQKQQ